MQESGTIADHVPLELVRTCPLFDRIATTENPYERMIPAIHAEYPRVSYVTNIFPGKRPGWMLIRAEDVRALLQDTENFEKRGMGQWSQGIGENWLVIPTEADPPEHAHYRKALNEHFTPAKMMGLSDQIRDRARSLIDVFKQRGSCNFIGEFSESYPVNIVLDLLGLPQARMPEFLRWEREMLHTDDMTVRGNATRAVKNYLLEEIESRRRTPQDDYITRIFDFDYDGRKWTDDEVLGHCFNLYLGGLDTVTSLLGLMFQFLARNPGHQQQLRDDPKMIVVAVEELLRAFAPVTSFRICSKPTLFQGVQFMPGDYVSVATSLAGRDPLAYDNPDEIRFDRKPSIITLGGGIHKCLGMHLARRELQIAIEEWLAAIPEFRVKDGTGVPFFVGNILHVQRLELGW
jgi:cytochrome P450